jgi:hypothetical protein
MIIKITIAVILLYLFYRLARAWKRVGGPTKEKPLVTGEDLVEDPFCHTYVPVTHAHKVDIEGKTSETVYIGKEAAVKGLFL